MKKQLIRGYADLYKKTLLDDVVPFWMRHSVDEQYGGYFTCLDREGKVYDSDKFTWLQARQIWVFSMLYAEVSPRSEWLAMAENGVRFLKKFGRDEQGSFYFSLTREGEPLTRAFNIYADCFAALAFGAYAKATGDEEALAIAQKTYDRFLARQADPKGRFEKRTSVRPLQSFGLPMMTAYLTLALEDVVDATHQQPVIDRCIRQILHEHYDPQWGVVHEYVGPGGAFVDCFEGRLLNPGHGIEAMWFLMEIGQRHQRPALITKATDICLSILDHSWDPVHGGLFYFMDAKGAPPQQLEWDQKLWWVHQEALIALSKAYGYSRRQDAGEWYQKVHDYSWSHFPDPQFGEWYGYLSRAGQPLTPLKGGKWKGCFHTPRAMLECWKNFESVLSGG